MIKPEPLKGKIFIWDEDEDDWVKNRTEIGYDTIPNDAVASVEDVRAAVQWLKEKLSKEMDKGIWKYEIHNTIDEAFPDITDSPITEKKKVVKSL